MASDAGQVILVEGMDDLHAVAGFFRKLGLTKFIDTGRRTLTLQWVEDGSKLDIISAGSVEEARDFEDTLRDLEALDDTASLALVVDADADHANRWRSIETVLTRMGYNPPKIPTPEGTIVCGEGARPARIGVWIMPDNQQAGMLETFLSNCVPDGNVHPVWMAADSHTLALQGAVDEARRFKNVHLDKAKIHNYLAWSDPPGLPFGQAILKGILDAESEQAAAFLRWIREVFGFRGISGEDG